MLCVLILYINGGGPTTNDKFSTSADPLIKYPSRRSILLHTNDMAESAQPLNITYSLKSTPNDRFFEKLFMAVLSYSQSFCQKSAERKSPKKYFSSDLILKFKSYNLFFILAHCATALFTAAAASHIISG